MEMSGRVWRMAERGPEPLPMTKREIVEVSVWSMLPLALLAAEGVAFGVFGEAAQRWLVGGLMDQISSVLSQVAAQRGM